MNVSTREARPVIHHIAFNPSGEKADGCSRENSLGHVEVLPRLFVQVPEWNVREARVDL
jgi:hypothetical protein